MQHSAVPRNAPMEFSGKLTSKDVEDLGSLLRPRLYWVREIVEGWRGAALLIAIVWATILGLLGKTNPNWWAMAAIWAVIVAISAWTVRKVRREREQELRQFNAALPETVIFTARGVTWNDRDGQAGFVAWGEFTNWRERGRVVVLDAPGRKPAVVISIAHLSDIERQQVRDRLRSHIPPGP